MLLFKKIDAYAQLVLIVAGFVFSIAVQDVIFVLSYLIVGSWQVLSALIHLIGFNRMPVFKGRKWYLFTLLFLIIAGIFFANSSDLDYTFLVGLLYVSPLLAIWYAAICFGEIKLWEQHDTPEII